MTKKVQLMTRDELRAIDKQIGLRIKARRQELKMSQTDLGNFCGISFQQVQKYETGANRISGSRLVQIAACLKCGPGELLELDRQTA